MVPINYLAVIVSTILSMILGFLWYGPLFGKPWMTLMGITKESMSGNQKGMGKTYALMALGSLITVFVLAHVVVFASAYTNTVGWMAGVSAAFWSWIGFVAPISMGTVLWEGKPWKLWLINSSYYLVSFIISGTILALWK